LKGGSNILSGVGGSYLSEPTTLKNLNAFWLPELLDRDWRKEWEAKGWKSLFQKACRRVDEIFTKHEPQPLDKDVNKELEAILKKADKELIKTTVY
jgi:trimethylamine--corrinoid protein Co-methyltransferase